MHSILLQATLRISYTSYIRQYIRRCSGSIGLGHCRGHCSTWPGLFFLGVMVILSSLGLHHTHHRRSPYWKSHLHHLRYHLTGKHRRHHPQHVVGRSTTSLLVDPVHHRHAAACTVSERYDLPQQTSEKTNGCRDSATVIATLITAMHACHRMFLHFLTFFMFRDFSRYFEFWVPGPSNIVAFTFDLPLEIFRVFFSAVLVLFFVFVYIVSFTSLVFFCTPPCPFTCRHPLALAFFPFSIHLPLCWGSINTATFWWIHHRSSMVSHVTFGHVNSTKNDSRQQKVCKHVDYERISTWQCHDNYGGLNLVLCPAHEHAITSIYFWATKHIISLFKPSTISLSQTFYTKTLVEMIKFYRLNHPLFIYIYIYTPGTNVSRATVSGIN